MKKEFNLSDKINDFGRFTEMKCIPVEDVKEFIRLLKKEIDKSADKTDIWDNERWPKFKNILRKEIDKLAGSKLI